MIEYSEQELHFLVKLRRVTLYLRGLVVRCQELIIFCKNPWQKKSLLGKAYIVIQDRNDQIEHTSL